jgi:hypothetical protein
LPCKPLAFHPVQALPKIHDDIAGAVNRALGLLEFIDLALQILILVRVVLPDPFMLGTPKVRSIRALKAPYKKLAKLFATLQPNTCADRSLLIS